jgi:predicted transposase YbfD/YdcC
MNCITSEEAKELAEWNQPGDVRSIYVVLQHLTDRRGKQGKRYSLALILTLLLLAKAAGETTLQAMAEWVRLRSAWLQEVLPGIRPTFPCAATYSNVLRAVDPDELNEVLMSLLTRVRAEQRAKEEQRHVALDGKTLRGTQKHQAPDQKKMHQVSLYETQTGIVLKEQVVRDKESEQTRVEEFLTPLYVKGRIVSADALHTHANVCLSILASGGDYVLFAKGNQSTLKNDLQLFFAEPPVDCRDWRTAETTNAGHGRLEQRALIASSELNDFLARTWPGVGQVFRLRRRFHHAFKCTQQIVYGFTSLTKDEAGPERLLELIRAHWAIENKLHYRRDVTLREDACQVRKGQAPRTLAILNSFVLALFDWLEVSNVASQMRVFAAQPFLALRLLLGPLQNIK